MIDMHRRTYLASLEVDDFTHTKSDELANLSDSVYSSIIKDDSSISRGIYA